jgi:hypothetical protein
MDAAETYVVRIYRRTPGARLAGTVETVGGGRTVSFRSFRELRAILQAAPRSNRARAPGKA